MKGIQKSNLDNVIEYLYNGEVNIGEEELYGFLDVARTLKVKGLQESEGTKQNQLFKVKDHSPPEEENQLLDELSLGCDSYTCSICSKTSKTRDSLRKHINKTHSNSLFDCEICDKTGMSKVAFDNHLQSKKHIIRM